MSLPSCDDTMPLHRHPTPVVDLPPLLSLTARRDQVNIRRLPEREIQRVTSEIKLLRTLKHPALIKIYSAFQKGDRIIFITELMTSGTLQQ